MKQIGGVWLPDHEQHLIGWMQQRNEVVDGKLTYQYHKLQAALAHVKNFRKAVDIGAHCGLWSMHLVKRFEMVHAFEPVAEHRECWNRNVPGYVAGNGTANSVLYECALGEQFGDCAIHTSTGSSGDSWVDGQAGDIRMRTLDSFDFIGVDFIKVDCEGYELFILKGGEETLKRCHPCVIVEQKPGRAQKFQRKETEAVDYLRSLGAVLRREMSGDFILSWD